MDGILADFVRGALAYHKRSDLYENYPPGLYNIQAYLQKEDFWNLDTYFFWLNLEETKDAKKIVKFCKSKFSYIYIVTDPTKNCFQGKLDWMMEHFPEFATEMIFIHNKYLLANEGTFLIDDYDQNVDHFISRGGGAYLYPRPWNRDHDKTPNLEKLAWSF
jgi:5'(3')-deoxyribonucleotidase